MNRADARRVGEALEARGYAPTRDPRDADLMLLNTCVVRQSAEDKVIGRLNSLRNLALEDGRALLVMGCFVGDGAELAAQYPFVDGFFAPSDTAGVMAFVDEWEQRLGRGCGPSVREVVSAAEIADLVPISYGCDHHCTYCLVVLRRGAQRSRPVGEIRDEVAALVVRGAREIVLLGQNVDDYGSDLPGHPSLADIMEAVHEIDDLWRIRFLTSHPREMSQRIIDTVARLPRVCESWELPVQAGDDQVLRRMGRGYTVEHYRELVGRIRAATPGGSINTDIIVGFSGETAAQFERTLDLVRELRFDAVHLAAYSVRAGTPAAAWPDDVPAEEKERRRLALEEVQTAISAEINAALLGRTVEVLVDGRQKGRWRGRTRTNKLVFFDHPGEWLGRLAQVRVTWTGPWSFIGEVQDGGAAD